jgi:hypothetical protein
MPVQYPEGVKLHTISISINSSCAPIIAKARITFLDWDDASILLQQFIIKY